MNFRFDLKTLQIFVAVVESRSITKAAEREFIAASAVSKRISDLEENLAATLLQRLPRGVEPTVAGQALYHHAKAILSSVERLTGELSDYAKGVKGHVRISANKSAVVQFLPHDLRTFIAARPDVRVDLSEENTAGVIKAVAEGQADIGIFIGRGAEDAGLELHPYRQDRLALLVPSTHALAGRASVRFSEAVRYEMIGLDVISAWNDLLSSAAKDSDETLHVRFRVNSFDAVCGMVSAGLGIAITPEGVLATLRTPDLVTVPLDEPWAVRQLVLGVRALGSLSLAARMMVSHLSSVEAARP